MRKTKQSGVAREARPDTQCLLRLRGRLGLSRPAGSEDRRSDLHWVSSSVDMHNNVCVTGPECCLPESCSEAFALVPCSECLYHSVSPFLHSSL